MIPPLMLVLLSVALFGGQPLAAQAGSAAPEPEEIAFEFAPPDPTKYMQRIETTREKIFEGLGTQTDQSVSETEISIVREGEGFVMVGKPLSMKMTRDGNPIEDPVTGLLKDVVVTYRISGDGQIESIDGYGGLLERMGDDLPPATVQALSAVLSEEALVNRETAEWNGRIGDFAEGVMSVGEVFEAEVPFAMPTGESIQYRTRTWVSGLEACEAGQCARVELRYDSDAQALAEAVGQVANEFVASVGSDLSVSTSGSRITGSVTRLIDPSTMLIYSESMTRTLSMTIEIPGQGPVPTVMKEQRDYTFQYGAVETAP